MRFDSYKKATILTNQNTNCGCNYLNKPEKITQCNLEDTYIIIHKNKKKLKCSPIFFIISKNEKLCRSKEEIKIVSLFFCA